MPQADQSKTKNTTKASKFWRAFAIILFGLIVLTQTFDVTITPKKSQFLKKLLAKFSEQSDLADTAVVNTDEIINQVLPKEGFVLPITWDNLGKQMIRDGVINEQKFRALFDTPLSSQDEQMLIGSIDQQIVINEQNSRFILDILWAFGLSNKNEILETGEMTDPKYGGDASQFASTGGWSLSKGKGFDHYSKHKYVTLTQQEQALIDKVSRNIYRPCCGNSTHFPDCNHGMAMLGLLELMAKNGVSEKDMYRVALQVNSFWFPQTYIDLATYFKEQGQDWSQVDPQIVLSSKHSSSKGYQQTKLQIQTLPKSSQGGGGCGV